MTPRISTPVNPNAPDGLAQAIADLRAMREISLQMDEALRRHVRLPAAARLFVPIDVTTVDEILLRLEEVSVEHARAMRQLQRAKFLLWVDMVNCALLCTFVALLLAHFLL